MSLVLMDRTFDHINLFLFVAAAVCILNHVSCKATEKEKTDTSTKLYSLVLCFPLLSSPKNSHTPPYQTRSLPSVSMEKSKHNYRMQLFKYCDIWSLAGTKSACNERLGYKDWEDRERISAACPHPSTKHTHTHTHKHTALYQLCIWLHFVQCWEMATHARTLLVLSVCCCRHFTAHSHDKQTWQSGDLSRSIICINHVLNKHDIEWWFFKRNFYQKESWVI